MIRSLSPAQRPERNRRYCNCLKVGVLPVESHVVVLNLICGTGRRYRCQGEEPKQADQDPGRHSKGTDNRVVCKSRLQRI